MSAPAHSERHAEAKRRERHGLSAVSFTREIRAAEPAGPSRVVSEVSSPTRRFPLSASSRANPIVKSRSALRLVALAALLLLSLSMSTRSSAAPLRTAPAFTLPGRAGSVSLDSLRGRTVLVDFWASWCGPCRGSFPWMAALQKRLGERGLTVVAINLDKDREKADRFLAEIPAPFTVAFDPAGKTAESYHVSAMPTSFLVLADGRVKLVHPGFDPRKSGEFERRIEEALPR